MWSLDVKGNWINNGGTFTAGTSTVGFNGTSAQTISGTTTFNNLTINNGTGGSTTLAADATVNGTLTLTTDLQTASSNNLTLGSSATCSGNGDVLGNVKRTSISAGSTYCFGNPNVSINFASGTFASPSIVMSLVKPKPANADFSNAVNRLYSINANGVDSFTATLRLHYLDAELNGNTEGATLALWKFVGSNTWTKFDNTNNNTTNNWVEHNAITGFSSWVLSNNAPASPTPITIASMEVESGGPDLTHATVAIGALGILAFGAIIFARN
ncbi:MAG: hypothetical protein HY868_16055 [Chloroflexi bacterium]|nr:hypothetical protein [Chloroflexota bacterium]